MGRPLCEDRPKHAIERRAAPRMEQPAQRVILTRKLGECRPKGRSPLRGLQRTGPSPAVTARTYFPPWRAVRRDSDGRLQILIRLNEAAVACPRPVGPFGVQDEGPKGDLRLWS